MHFKHYFKNDDRGKIIVELNGFRFKSFSEAALSIDSEGVLRPLELTSVLNTDTL